MSLEDRVALVTGASRGIGRSIAMELGAQGATVIGTATSDAGAEAIGAALGEAGMKGTGMRLDVTDPESVDGVVKAIADQFGAVTILINNAGVTRDNLMMRMKDEEWDTVVETNLTAVFRVTRACLRGMTKARWGRIVNISSVVGASGNPGQSNYAATKAGVIGFSKSLGQEVASRGITVNVVAPGFIETDMTAVLPEEQKKALMDMIPMRRLGQPQDIAQAVSFLASDAAGYVTGTTLHVNGGMYMA
ncbi:MAG: 3-oxoacyl-ACP reductase FabG [Gammaproteobacteria bacterium]